MLYGVDVHPRYQAGLNLEALPAQGYSFAAVKASQGETLTITQFADWIGRIRKAGMIPGAYHWIVAGDGAGQCDYFLDRLAAVGGPEGLLIQLDCEDNATLADIQAWAARWRQRTNGHPFLLYTGKWWWGPRGWNGAAITPFLWDSHYLLADLDTVPDNPATFAARIPASWWVPGYGQWPAATCLQFTSKGDAGGLGNNVDLNATKLTRAQLLALTTAGGGAPAPEEDEMRVFHLPSGYVVVSDGVTRRHLTGAKAEACITDAWQTTTVQVTPAMLDGRTEEQWMDIACGVDVAELGGGGGKNITLTFPSATGTGTLS